MDDQKGKLNGLDLFSGIGGISLALQPWVRTVCYVEIESFPLRVLQKQIKLGNLDDAPIWDDVKTFDPGPWIGAVDIISGGFPCQDISAAGKGAGLEGERSGLFFEIIRLAGEIRPRFIFLENVPAVTAFDRGGGDVVGALTALQYDCRWGIVSAFDVGAPHQRDRWWLLAHTNSDREPQQEGGFRNFGGRIGNGGEDLADPDGDGCCGVLRKTGQGADGPQLGANSYREGIGNKRRGAPRSHASDTDSPRLEIREGQNTERTGADGGPFFGGSEPWAVEPALGRVAHGVPDRVDRLKGLGNSVVPACAREAFRRLSGA